MGIIELTKNFKIPAKAKKIVLVGNPNVGKSVFFNALTNRYVEVSNFPGTTVDISYSSLGSDVLIDTPGIYGVSSFNDEEKVAREMILQADVVINIVDALHLERDLFLTQQLIDMDIPMIIALNMMDEARQQGVEIDVQALEEYFGVPVIPTVAVEGKGMAEVLKSLDKARAGHKVPEIMDMLASVKGFFPNAGEALLYLEEDPLVEPSGPIPQAHRGQEELYLKRRLWVNEIAGKVVREGLEGATFAARLGHLLLRPFPGVPALLLSLAVMYYFIGVFIAQVIVEFTEEVIMEGYYRPFMENLVDRIFSLRTVTGYILAGEYGILTMTAVYLLGLLMPLVAGFYFSLSVMEDSGYLPRIATLTDRILVKMGLNGRAIIPIILGLGCVTMATITTRILGSSRERIIATALLGIAIPCSAQLGVIFGMVSPLGLGYLTLYLAVIALVFIGLGVVMEKFIPGRSTDLLMDLPHMRLPRLKNVFKKTYNRTIHFLKEALPLFALGALLISLLNISGSLLAIQKFLSPLVNGWMKLPEAASTAFIMGIVRRDFGAAGLYSLQMSPGQTLVSLVAITLFVPCIASILIIFKERGLKDGLLIWIGSFMIAFLSGGILARIII
ncbi:MAG: ferrous iron transport protein B [Dethiobacter sp.]|jgi:ferrous iron transport protein B|nr:MAG: ferrous iron transport protein B [Dethiobacter sp.]